MHPRITRVTAASPFKLDLAFADGSTGTADLTTWLQGRRGVFAPLQDPEYFALVTVDREVGTVVWPNGADLDPDMLYEAAHSQAVP